MNLDFGSDMTKFDGTVTSLEEEEEAEIDMRRLTRKVDIRILPLLLLTYSLQFMDKLALSNASVYGIRDSNNIDDSQYSWVSSIFYFGFLAGQFPLVELAKKYRLGKIAGLSVMVWGAILACTAASHSYGALLACRFLLGLFESAISPTFVLLTSRWYTPSQQPLRISFWFAGNDLGGIVSGFIAFGIGHITGSLYPWQYLFIIYGCATFVLGIVLFFFLADDPSSAKFLTDNERSWYAQKNQVSAREPFNWYQALEALIDPQLLLYISLTVLNILPNGGVVSYGLILVKSFGFSSIETTALQVPGSAITWIAILLFGLLSSKIPNFRCYALALTVLLPIVGASVLYRLPESPRGVRLMAYYFLLVQPATFPLLLAMITSNIKGATKKPTSTAIIFIWYCASNIAAPQLFREAEKPAYPTAMRAWIVCFALTVLLSMILRAYLGWQNNRRKKSPAENVSEPEKSDLKDFSLIYLY